MGADSTRNILLEIAAHAEFKELKALNTELKESINTVARLRAMLKGDIGVGGLKGTASGAIEAGKATQRLAGEFKGANAEAEALAASLEKTGKLLKTQRTVRVTKDGLSESTKATLAGGLGETSDITRVNGVVTKLHEAIKVNKDTREEFSKPWRERSADEVIDRANIENMQRDFDVARRLNREREAETRRTEAERVKINKEASKKILNEAYGEYKDRALQERAAAKQISDAQVSARGENKDRAARQKAWDDDAARMRRISEEKAKAADLDWANDKRAAIAENARIDRMRRSANMKQTFNQQRAQKGAVVTPVDVYNQKTGQIDRVLKLTNDLTGAQFKLNTATGKVTGGFRDLSAAQERTGDSFGKIIGKVAIWSVATGAVFGTIRAIRNAITSFAEIEKGTIAVARVTENFGQGMSGIGSGAKVLTKDILDLSVQYGQNAKDAMEAAVIYGRLGMSQREIADAMKYTMATANISGYGMEESAKGIASIIQQFQLGAKDIPGLVDKLSYVDRLSSATMGDLMEAGSRAAGVWHEAGGSVEEFAALVGVVAQRTGRSGAEIGNAFKTMLNRLGTAETQKKLFEMSGISVRDAQGAFKSPMQILKELRNKTESVTSGVAREIEGETAGSRQVNFLINALKGLPDIEKQIEAQANAAGAALEQNKMYMEGMSVKAQQLGSAWTAFTTSVVEGDIGNTLKNILDDMRNILTTGERIKGIRGLASDIQGLNVPMQAALSLKQEAGLVWMNYALNRGGAKEFETKFLGRRMDKSEEQGWRAMLGDAYIDEALKARSPFWTKAINSLSPPDLEKMVAPQKKSSNGFWKRMIGVSDNVFGGTLLEQQGQLKDLEDKLHAIQVSAKIQLRLEDELAITPLEAIDEKMMKIKERIADIEKLKTMFPALKGDGEAAKKIDENLQRLWDMLTSLQEERPVANIKQLAQEGMKKMVSARESKEFLAGRIARSPLSGKEETAGLRESLALLAQNREIIKGYKQELMTLSVSTDGREMTSDEKAKELNIQKEIHELEQRDAALVGRVDRERVEAMIKVREAAQQTYETTRKAMGQMSDVDLARARITAGRFKRGELKQFGEEAWSMPAEMRAQFTRMEELFPGMRLMPEMNSTPQDWFTRAERKGPNGERAFQPFAPIYDEATKGLTLSMNIGDAENKIDALGNSLIAYLSTNIGQLWDELIARTDAAARPPQTKKVQGTVR